LGLGGRHLNSASYDSSRAITHFDVISALRALIEDRVFASNKALAAPLDVHGLNDVADRTMNESGKEIGYLGEWF
jgi:hypothetical protein